MADPASLQATLMPSRAPRLGQPGAAEARPRVAAPQPVALDAASSGALGPVQLERLKTEVAEVQAQLAVTG